MNASHISAYSSITAQVHNLSQQLADYTSGYIAPSCPTRHTMLHHDINLLTIYTHTPTDHPTAVSIINQQTQKNTATAMQTNFSKYSQLHFNS